MRLSQDRRSGDSYTVPNKLSAVLIGINSEIFKHCLLFIVSGNLIIRCRFVRSGERSGEI